MKKKIQFLIFLSKFEKIKSFQEFYLNKHEIVYMQIWIDLISSFYFFANLEKKKNV
jgi:hypothetical protein